MYWPTFLTYGNWGGPGWSGGRFVNDPKLVDWTVSAIDKMDEAFKEHDAAWQTEAMSKKAADKRLLQQLYDTNVLGTWPNMYRIGAIMSFWITSKLPWRR